MTSLDKAKALALAVPAALLAGAFAFQYIGHLFPCEMCWWQRYAHMTALVLAILAYALKSLPDRGRSIVWLAALAILGAGLIGFYHAGVEMKVFPGITTCSSVAQGSAEDIIKQVLASPVIRCEDVQWSLLGISMAGWNFIISTVSALLILWLSLKTPRRSAA